MTRASSTKVRRACFEHWKQVDETGATYLVCYLTGIRIYPSRGDKWEAEHSIPHALGGSDEPPNVKPVLVSAHQEKTPGDIAAIAKCKRLRDKHFGVKRPGSALGKKRGTKYDWKQGRYVRVEGDKDLK